MTTAKPDYILLIDKPAGMTSFDVIRQLRRQTGVRKFGHAGTLDPAATGLLVLGVGSGTKQLQEYIKLDKEYEASILLGESRTTSDMDGEVLKSITVPPESISADILRAAVEACQGTLRLPVSAYSAIKKNGVPMYKRARQAAQDGTLVTEVPVRDMQIYKAEFLGHDIVSREGRSQIILRVRFFVGSGTYIRSLAEAIGGQLDCPAVLYRLRRTKVGDFSVEDAVSPEQVKAVALE